MRPGSSVDLYASGGGQVWRVKTSREKSKEKEIRLVVSLRASTGTDP